MIKEKLLNFIGRFPLRFILIVPFVSLIFISVGLTGYLSFKNGQKAVNDVAGQLRKEVVGRIQDHLKEYMSIPIIINKINSDEITLNHLNYQNNTDLGKHFWHQLHIFKSVTYINTGKEDGTYFSVGRVPGGAYNLGEVDSSHSYYNYVTGPFGEKINLESVTPNFYSYNRPWYKKAFAVKGPAWSPLYTWLAPHPGISIAAVQPLYDKSGKKLGVLSVDLGISDVSEFLKSLNVGKTGKVFIMERDGLLITSSAAEEPFFIDANRKEVSRLNAIDSNVSLIKNTTKFLHEKYGENFSANGVEQTEAFLEGKKQFIQLSPFTDEYGLDWLIVVVIPESDFMEQIEAHTKTTIFLCIISFIASTLVGVLTAWWIIMPISVLNRSTKAIAKGEWSTKIPIIKRSDELGELWESFVNMAGQLKESFQNLEHKVEDRTKELNKALAILGNDLNLAKKIQNNMLKYKINKTEGLKFNIYYLPMQQVGGDFYSINEINSSITRIFLADATGHGVQAALITMLIKSEYENLCESVDDSSILLSMLNTIFYNKYAFLTMFFSCVIIDIDKHNNQVVYAFAGHPPQVLLSDSIVKEFGMNSNLIGVKKSVEFPKAELNIKKGDRLILFTDGAFEETNSTQEMFGEERFYSSIAKNVHLDLMNLTNNAIAELDEFMQGKEKDDDITIIGIEIV
jgi:sigma-B regulation protein RsbU (phosphoserine phosphatase)